jgi:hypothetical protein
MALSTFVSPQLWSIAGVGEGLLWSPRVGG